MASVMKLLILLINCLHTTSSVGDSSMYNAALYKPAYQSSTYDEHIAARGVDGDKTDVMGSGHCQHTLNDDTPWWMVDLMGQFVIEMVVMTNRFEDSTRLQNFAIDIFTTDPRQLSNFTTVTGQVCYSQITPLTSGTFTWLCTAPIVGRFVRVMMFAQEYLHFCELEVYVSAAFYRELSYIIKTNRMLTFPPIVTVKAASVLACSQQCFSQREEDVKCTAFNWIAKIGACQLFQLNPKDPGVTSSLVFQDGCNFFMEEN